MLFWLWLVWAVQVPQSNYPPDGVILLQESGEVNLKWKLRGSSYRLQVWEGSRSLYSQTILRQEQQVSLPRGKPLLWQVTSAQGGRFSSTFSIAETAAYHLDGRQGLPIRPGYRGLGGTGGGQLRCRLSRDQAGMHLVLWRPGGRDHYLFSQPGLRFTLTARGGEGAWGSDGRDGRLSDDVETRPEPGVDGTAGGNGGHILISTASAPWREFLDVDVSFGKGGKGGLGGRFALSEHDRAPDGRNGTDGFPGRIETVISDGW
jgi:hypothetical protein